jgi:hypothetical protein
MHLLDNDAVWRIRIPRIIAHNLHKQTVQQHGQVSMILASVKCQVLQLVSHAVDALWAGDLLIPEYHVQRELEISQCVEADDSSQLRQDLAR